jgi:recombinational DNA repair ATPase RecF
MPRHPDATGYLNDLATEINDPWFKRICDLAAVSGLSVLDDVAIEKLFALYSHQVSYTPIQPTNSHSASAVAAVAVDALEQLTGFSSFKSLGDTLDLKLPKRLNLIFGTNGSGKSSLCESLKVLATPRQPIRPLENVRATGPATPTFRFKFKNDAGPQTWTPSVGYGPRNATVKYFDTGIAIQNVTSAIEPGRVILVSPFKLNLFEWTKALTTQFREAAQAKQRDNAEKLSQALLAIRGAFGKFNARPLAVITEATVSGLGAQIKLAEEFNGEEKLREKRASIAELEKATSEDGLKLLRAERRELESLVTAVNNLLSSVETLWSLEPTIKAKNLANKQAAQLELSRELIPDGSTLDDLLPLLHVASPMCKMDDATGQACPLCKRNLSDSEVDLFKRYHELLVGQLEKEITSLKADLAEAKNLADFVSQMDRRGWEKFTSLPEGLLKVAMIGTDLIVANSTTSTEPTQEAQDALVSLKAGVASWTGQLEAKQNAIDAAATGRDELVKKLSQLRDELEPLEYAHSLVEHLKSLRDAQGLAVTAQFWKDRLPAFTQILRRITESAKIAHEELVVGDFEARLESEYQALAEKSMAAFGVKLARKGSDASVTVVPQVGGKSIEGVLSEGEQRLHALALFFAELETCQHSVLVFDDPISSFDYNYVANFCARLRNFTLRYPDRQIIVLTHNWDFFVQLQTTLNSVGLNGKLSVQVLESCSVVADYSERVEDLKDDISRVLAMTGEPSKALKEEMAGKMRRLMESIVNTHVFNKQRHQYKQKSLAISEFNEFTKLVPLLSSEATTLRDLYGKLSVSEHDDPRNAYVNTDKATFTTRYNAILAIEAAIVSRK